MCYSASLLLAYVAPTWVQHVRGLLAEQDLFIKENDSLSWADVVPG